MAGRTRHNARMQYDVFICHATEDKESVARPLLLALQEKQVSVWMDELRIGWGASLKSEIDRGLAKSRYGIVVLSKAFFEKKWTKVELAGLTQRQVGEDRVVILPLYVDIDNDFVRERSPILADQLALNWQLGADAVAVRFCDTFRGGSSQATQGISGSQLLGGEMSSRARRLLAAGHAIDFEELIQKQTEDALGRIRLIESDLSYKGDEAAMFSEFKRRLADYESVLEDLSATLVVAAFSGGADQHIPVKRALGRVADEPNDLGKHGTSGIPIWLTLRKYPAILLFHRVGAAAVAAERWANLYPLFVSGTVSRGKFDSVRTALLPTMRPHELTIDLNRHWYAYEDIKNTQVFYTPAEDYLAVRVIEALAWVGVDRAEADDVFDQWLFLAQVARCGEAELSDYKSYFSGGRWWRNREWVSSPQSRIVQQVKLSLGESSILKSGVASSNDDFLKRVIWVRELIVRESNGR